MKLTVQTVGGAAVRRELLKIAQAPRRALDRLAEDIEEQVERDAGKHSKTGALFNSVGKRRTGQSGWLVGHDLQRAKHALFVHWGTKPHTIAPKRKKALRWVSGNRFAFAKRVRHPGYRGDPWLVRAASQAPLIFDRHVRAILQSRGA